MAERGDRRTNGQVPPQGGDLYKQLIDNNDMVKELDDIEAISQQISQHAEVLYNSWKSNGLSHGQAGKLGSGRGGSSSSDGGREALRERGGPSNGSRQYHTLRTDREGRVVGREEAGQEHAGLGGPGNYHSLERARVPGAPSSSDSSSPRHSAVSSPSSSTRESPQRGSSITQISHAPAEVPLELLASPNLNGNLEDLVSSFVSTDRAKQAARNTISSTIRRRLGSPNGSSSPVRSPSPTSSPLGFKGTTSSPLRSPMMTNMASPSPPSDSHSSPRSPTSMFNQSEATNRVAVGFLQSSDIHAPMQSIFGPGPKPTPSTPLQVATSPQRPAPPLLQPPGSKTSPLLIQTSKEPGESIPIPVKHIPIAITNSSTPSQAHGLKSAALLQNVNKDKNFYQPINNKSPMHIEDSSPFQRAETSPSQRAETSPFQSSPFQRGETSPFQREEKSPFQLPSRPPGEGMEKMSNFFDEFGSPRDPETAVLQMRKRMEEAKQRMALSLPAREGGIRPNSFSAMGSGSLFERSPWGEDPSAFLLEQFRRRNKRRMEPPGAPHPELTPQQKQHISDRTEPASQQLPRRLLPNGSVAERVLMFEKSPSVFGEVRGPAQRREPSLTGTSLSPASAWRPEISPLQVRRDQRWQHSTAETCLGFSILGAESRS